jgi:hypothetical protein
MAIPTTFVWPLAVAFVANPQRYLDPIMRELAREINRPGWRGEGQAVVAAGTGTIVVPVDIDRFPYYVTATPSWNTTVWIAPGRTLTQFTLNFGTAAPGGGGVCDWHLIQPEQGASYS